MYPMANPDYRSLATKWLIKASYMYMYMYMFKVDRNTAWPDIQSNQVCMYSTCGGHSLAFGADIPSNFTAVFSKP